jgi:hypothetical protein
MIVFSFGREADIEEGIIRVYGFRCPVPGFSEG